ncbi:hypothetical protein V8F06_003587 [Rhypophila decipiens]
MPKNSSITSFFKPVSKNSSSQQSGSGSGPEPQFLSPHRKTLPILSSPSRHSLPPPSSPAALAPSSPIAPVVRDRNAVIRGSDDEDDDDSFSSDDDLPSLFSRPKVVPARSRKDLNLCATPKAKRTAMAFHSSPMTIQPKHKFDFKALMKHAQADNALEESEQRMQDAYAAGSPTSGIKANLSDTISPSGRMAQINLHDSMLDVFSEPEGSQDEGNREKLLRAVKRSQASPDRKQYHFFDNHTQEKSIGVRGSFPKSAAKGPWKFLAKEQGRTELFEDGVPYFVQFKLRNLPDEIFSWVLWEIPVERSARLRAEYLRLLEVCDEQGGRLIDENMVVKFFRDLGASDRALDLGSLDLRSHSPDPVKKDNANKHKHKHTAAPHNEGGQRDWTGLGSVLEILSRTSQGLRLPSIICTTALLIRLGMDRLIREDPNVELEYQQTFWWLTEEVPGDSWDKFCFDIATSVYDHVSESTLRWDAVSCIPLLSTRLLDLRRRLSIAFFFDDPKRAQLSPDQTFSIRAVIDHMDSDDTGAFIIDRRQQTDFFELASLIELLAIAIGDGNRPLSAFNSAAVDRQFDADVDELSKRLKIMVSRIPDQGAAYVSRFEAKGVLKDVERKLQYLTRTRPPPKDIFGMKEMKEEEEEAEQRPKQRKFMERFLAAGKGESSSGTDSTRERVTRSRSPSLPTMSKRVPKPPPAMSKRVSRPPPTMSKRVPRSP